MARQAIGIDFGHSSIKLVEVKRGKQLQIKRAVLLPLPPEALAGGVIQNAELVNEALSGLSSALRLERSMVVAGVAGTQVHVRPARVPEAPAAELYPQVMREFAAALRLLPEEEDLYYIDYAVLPSAGITEREVLMVGMRRLDAVTFADVLREAHMPPYVLEVQAFALPRVWPRDDRACYIDIGAEQTQVLVVSAGEYELYRLLPIGMRRLRAEIVKAYGISEEEAQALQLEQHIDMIMVQAPGQRAPLQAAVDELVGGIIQTLEYLRARQRAVSVGELVPHAYLSGGGALQKGMDYLLSEEIGLNVTALNPFANCLGVAALPAETQALAPLFAGALGLALRGLEE